MSAGVGLPAKELAAIEASITWGHPTETGITNDQARRLVADIRRLERDNFALRQGLHAWERIAKDAEARLSKEVGWQAIVDAVSAVVDEHHPHLTGTLVERVRWAITGGGQ